ncbi:MAG: hypothetical protein AB7K24_10975 [Gemmataceae bacterium]
MTLEQRRSAIDEIEKMRSGRQLVALCTFDRDEHPAHLGANLTLTEDIKEPLYRVLKETVQPGKKLDLFLYTRGGDTRAVWPIVCLLREFDPDFEVLIPFRAHGCGTLLALAAKKIVMTPLAELSLLEPAGSPIDVHSNGNGNGHVHGVGVEDVSSYLEFVRELMHANLEDGVETVESHALEPHLKELTSRVHPLALGRLHRERMQIKMLAQLLLLKHYGVGDAVDNLIEGLTTNYYSQQHLLGRYEARDLLGENHVEFARPALAGKLDLLLQCYEDDFQVRQPLFLNRLAADKDLRLVGGCVESHAAGYLYQTSLRHVEAEIPAEIVAQSWARSATVSV